MARLLVAEDDPGVQMLVRKIVQDMGHIVVLSPDGQHALTNLITNKDFDLLITDVDMPKMSGVELIDKLREKSETKDLPIIMISSVVSYSDISDVLETGATYFVAKPFKRKTLEDYIHRSLQK